jgi:hypothetical protein
MFKGSTWSRVEDSRIRAVVLKLARGHAAYELAAPLLDTPESMLITTFVQMKDEDRASFEATPPVSVLPGVGSRAMQLLIEGCSCKYRQLLDQLGIRVSMSGRGNCYDNAPMESFWGTLKQELVHHRHYTSQREACRRLQNTLRSSITGSVYRQG